MWFFQLTNRQHKWNIDIQEPRYDTWFFRVVLCCSGEDPNEWKSITWRFKHHLQKDMLYTFCEIVSVQCKYQCRCAKSVDWGRTVKKNKKRMMLEYVYRISFYCTQGGWFKCWILCSYDKSSKDKGDVLRFKWETPLFFCFLVTMFLLCRKCQVMCYTYCISYIDNRRQFRLL